MLFDGQPIDLLNEAAKLVEDAKNVINNKNKWCKGSYAIARGWDMPHLFSSDSKCVVSLNSTNDKACQWCASGAMIKAFSNIYKNEYMELTLDTGPNDYVFLKQATLQNIVFSIAMRFLANEIDADSRKSPINLLIAFNDLDKTDHDTIVALFDKTIGVMKRTHYMKRAKLQKKINREMAT